MAWQIKFTARADKAIRKLSKETAKRILNELEEISKLENPFIKGKALKGNLSSVWCYRVGDYRILCDIAKDSIVVLVLDVGHRREVYKRL